MSYPTARLGSFLGESAVLRHFAYVLPVLVLGEAHHVEDPATKIELKQEMCS
jgi:hypothetical protein